MLSDLDRPIEPYPFEPWNRDVLLRAISATQFVEVMGRLSAAGDDDKATKIAIFAAICAYGITDPVATAEAWAAETKLGTLMHLGNKVLEVTNRTHNDVAKKN